MNTHQIVGVGSRFENIWHSHVKVPVFKCITCGKEFVGQKPPANAHCFRKFRNSKSR